MATDDTSAGIRFTIKDISQSSDTQNTSGDEEAATSDATRMPATASEQGGANVRGT